jgi:epsin
MDLNSLKEQVSNLTLYDIKAGVRKVQNGTSNLISPVSLCFNTS